VSSDHRAYYRLLVSLWAEGPFVIVEHDIVPAPGMVHELWNCPRDWCAFPYRMDDIVTTAFGLVKFDPELLPGAGDLLGGIIEQHRVWSGLDSIVIAELHRRGYKEHEHQPPVEHLHEPAQPPQPRRRILTKLHYVGDGTRYVNGLPASDCEIDDPTTVAVAVESGLYEAEEVLTKPAKPAKLTKFIPFAEGGEMPPPTLAVIHEGEIIIPATKVGVDSTTDAPTDKEV
jgi:hypothetical protein